MQIGGHDSRIYEQQGLLNCANCNRRFPPDKIELHEAYCCRNYRKCQMCGIMVDKNSVQEHKNQVHSLKPCQYCGEKLMGRQLQMHEESCLAKPEKCAYCSKSCPRGQLEAHQASCGSKLKQCSVCQKLVAVKDLAGHTDRCSNRIREHRENSQQPPNPRKQLPRQNSQTQLNPNPPKKQKSLPKKQPAATTTKQNNIIPREQIKQTISPIPISIMLTLQQKAQINQQKGGLQNGRDRVE